MATQSEYHEQLAISRLNSFLVGTAFLITAYAVVVTAGNYASLARLLWLSYAISSLSFVMAIFFALGNYHSAKIMQYSVRDSEYKFSFRGLVLQFFWDVLGLPCYLLKPDRPPLVHTWFLPFLFIPFWIAMWISLAC